LINAGELKRGITIELDNQLYQVTDYQHIKMGRGSAQIKLRLRDIHSSHTIERVFQASEKFNRVFLEYRPMQHLYNDGDLYYFMDTETFDQIQLSADQLDKAVNYLKEGQSLEILTYKGNAIGAELPASVELEVSEAGPSFKGDTAAGGNKPAKLETGITIRVPLFINNGDIIKVDTRTGEYLERVS